MYYDYLAFFIRKVFCWMLIIMHDSQFSLVIGFAVMIAFVEACAQNSLKQSQIGHSSIKFYLGLLFYLIVGYILHHAYHSIGLGKMNLVWSCMSIIVALTAGYLLYDEPFDKYTITAIILAFSAIYVVHMGDTQRG